MSTETFEDPFGPDPADELRVQAREMALPELWDAIADCYREEHAVVADAERYQQEILALQRQQTRAHCEGAELCRRRHTLEDEVRRRALEDRG